MKHDSNFNPEKKKMCSSRSFITTAAQEATSSGLEKALSIMYSRNTLIHLFKMGKKGRGCFFVYIHLQSVPRENKELFQ